jgi:hypothetical protein
MLDPATASHSLGEKEGVMCELVSESPKFPASREKTGNFHRLALRSHQMMPNTGADPTTYEEIPYASEQGIFCG